MPSGPIDLLLTAGLAPDEQAGRAWVTWSRTHDLDHLSSAERRLLAAFSERIRWLDPSSPLISRIKKLTKELWTRAQLTLTAATSAFDALSSAHIPFLVFKGGGLLAEGFATSRRRVIGDVDLLVRPESVEVAIDALTGAGWSSVNGESPAYLRRLAQIRISGNYRKGRHGSIDLHISPFHFARRDTDLDQALWRDARAAFLGDRRVLVPDAADAIVIGLAHAPLSNSAEWALDIVTRIANQPVDWGKVAVTAQRRDLVPSCLAGLRYVRDGLSAKVPDSVLARLDAAPVTFASWLKFWSNVSDRQDRNLLDKAVNRCADGLLEPADYTRFVKDRALVTIARPSVSLSRLWRSAKGIPCPMSPLKTEHCFNVARDVAGRRLIIVIAVPRPPMSRRIFFDVAADGRAIARLRCRLGPSRRVEKLLTFSIPNPCTDRSGLRISIESRPSEFLPPDAPEALRSGFGAVAFRLVKAMVL